MTNDILDYMLAQGRRPSFDSRGNVRGFRSRPGAPMAAVQSGLDPEAPALRSARGSNAMEAGQWAATFRNKAGNTAAGVSVSGAQQNAQNGGYRVTGTGEVPAIPSFGSRAVQPEFEPVPAGTGMHGGITKAVVDSLPLPSAAVAGSEGDNMKWFRPIGRGGVKAFGGGAPGSAPYGSPTIFSQFGTAYNSAPGFRWNRTFRGA